MADGMITVEDLLRQAEKLTADTSDEADRLKTLLRRAAENAELMPNGIAAARAEATALPFAAPDGYDRAQFAPVAEQIIANGETAFVTNLAPGEDAGRFHAYDLQGGVGNWNSSPFLSLHLPGRSKLYRDGNWAARDTFAEEQARWCAGFLHFMANDTAVPQVIRDKAATWGLPDDEFGDSPYGRGFPHWLYVRAGLRLNGWERMTGLDQINVTANPHRVASFAYKHDSKEVTVWPDPDDATAVQVEGYIVGPDPTEPFDVSPKMMMTEPGTGMENLLVSNLVSSTSVAWSAIRLEPLLGMMGEVCGTLAAQCLSDGAKPVQSYDYTNLRSRLIRAGFNL
ncbi:FAD-dependent oxidoreductase [Tropicibacter sp. R16_0]|uniref:FAD-dependent oxidoreductase n=1 Tax=Tropicibacter sp. R16_0 TaxID=2821102 RepID=UPI001ADAB55D|nr:FAD-dependent oxidoreductase [Tropicibacter sp. R16_0]MBO9453147.1 FAD-dependent oxidoreductase [Tropicibacter sp. R16_0]